MRTLFLSPRQTADSQQIWKAAARGWTTHRLASWAIPEHLRAIDDPVFYAEALFAPAFAEQLGVRLDSPPEDWLVRLPAEYRRREVVLTTLGSARGGKTPRFIKPPNDKSFRAAVYLGAELPAGFDDGMAVLASEVVEWELEFRCFVLDRRLATLSLYARHGEPQLDQGYASGADEDRAATSFIETMLADPRVDLERTAVIDIGLIGDRGWACVEQNAAWGAGLYACDPDAALDVIAASMRR